MVSTNGQHIGDSTLRASSRRCSPSRLDCHCCRRPRSSSCTPSISTAAPASICLAAPVSRSCVCRCSLDAPSKNQLERSARRSLLKQSLVSTLSFCEFAVVPSSPAPHFGSSIWIWAGHNSLAPCSSTLGGLIGLCDLTVIITPRLPTVTGRPASGRRVFPLQSRA